MSESSRGIRWCKSVVAVLALACSVWGPGCAAEPDAARGDGAEPLARIDSALLVPAQVQKLLAMDRAGGDEFGYSVALSSDGSTALVGAYLKSDSGTTNNGAAYVFKKNAMGIWEQTQKLLAADKDDDDLFGWSVALSGDGSTALVGAPLESDSGTSLNGAAYAFKKDAMGTFGTPQKLLASDKNSVDLFGQSVALSSDGSTALVGARGEDDSGTSANGAAYVFTKDAMGTFGTPQKLLASDKDSDDFFGESVALSSDGSTALVGAPLESDSGTSNNGAAYVFKKNAMGIWGQAQKLLAPDKDSGDQFGQSVALSSDGNIALIGANAESDGVFNGNGAAYLFTNSMGTFGQPQKLLAPDKGSFDQFGQSVALSGDGNTALIGAPGEDDSGFDGNGAAYLFTNSMGTFGSAQKLLASDRTDTDAFGWSVALSGDGNTAYIGTPGEDDGGADRNGAVYLFELRHTNGDSCTNAAQCVSGFCSDGVCCDSACGGGLDGDCQACTAAKTQGGAADGTCGLVKDSVVCRNSAGACDMAERCSGVSPECPADALQPATVVCNPSRGPCDLEEKCTGASAACPADQKKPNGAVCSPAALPCDLTDTCDGINVTCPDQLRTAGTPCRAAGANPTCDPEDVCDGIRKSCPSRYAPPGSPCGADMTCSGTGICS